MEIAGKVAVVTGAGSGIGRATALRLAREGARVVVADIEDHAGHETVGLINDTGGIAHFYSVDVTDEASVSGMFAFAEAHFEGVDIVHNNAGTVTPQPRFPDAAPARWLRTLDVNLKGVLLGTYLAVPALKRRGGGAIVQTASMAGLAPWAWDPVYAATKAGVVNLTRSLTFLQEEANIRVNCVCPGLVRTNLGRNASRQAGLGEGDAMGGMLDNPERPGLQPDDVAEAVVRLIMDDSLNGRAYRVAANSEWELL
jgi:NAD(P)-dependent dehydrogenase (short-subunit alcohol dehydrogenase family)